ncbi:Uncharacterized protein HZ326_3349 [Fusarium oxysporum f. sp. albedinis]|nr:Uncharacterized protein HZ326_3349 [Fusarium oxysporum f. sp. albedinis]
MALHVTVAAYQRALFLRTHHAGEEKPSLLWESLCSSVSSGVLVVLQKIEDWSTGEVPETVKAGKRKLQEGFTTVTKIKKPRTLDSTNENQRSKLELAR